VRLLITGGPKTGKTTLANNFKGCPVYHTDDLIELGWSEQSRQIMRWLNKPDPWVIEGVAIVRSLRKWLRFNEEGLPFDHLIYLTRALTDRTTGQNAMDAGTRTIWHEIAPVVSFRAAALGKDSPKVEFR